jgi:hypothetical protein
MKSQNRLSAMRVNASPISNKPKKRGKRGRGSSEKSQLPIRIAVTSN